MVIAEAANVSKRYGKSSPFAVENVSLSIPNGKIIGLVGRSGCGKSTLSRLMLGLIEPDSGTVYFNGDAITGLSYTKKRKLRRYMQILFQHPDSTFHPRMRIIDSLIEPALLHRLYHKDEAEDHVRELLPYVGLHVDLLERYPHQLSGGQLQRIALARILTLKPRFIVLDEPTSMLDVSVQALIVERLQDVQKEFNLSYLFISHDLELIRYVSDEIVVMHEGQIVEKGEAEQIIHEPQHEYTKMLVRTFSQFSS